MFDTKANAHIRPFFMPNVAMAQRAIIDSGQQTDHPFALHPSDYILYELGTWDDERAEFTITEVPIIHGTVKQLTPLDKQPVLAAAETIPGG